MLSLENEKQETNFKKSLEKEKLIFSQQAPNVLSWDPSTSRKKTWLQKKEDLLMSNHSPHDSKHTKQAKSIPNGEMYS